MSFEYENEEPERGITPEEFLREQKSAIRKKSLWAIGIGSIIVLISVVGVWLLVNSFPEMLAELKTSEKGFFSILFRNILFLLGLFFVAGGIWGLFHAKNLKLEDFIASPEAIAFLEESRAIKPVFTYILVGCLITVFLAQLLADSQNPSQPGEISFSIESAGFVKQLFWQGEFWRILTSGALHGGILHIYFNSQAFYGFGSTIELLSNRAHLAIVFLLSIIGGGFLSLIFMPEGVSVGASGGIMGLVGYLAIFGYRRKKQLPPDFLKSMLINIGFIAAFGLVAWQIIDNFAHLGGLLTGAIYGYFQVPRDLHKNPRETNAAIKISGLLSVIIFISICVFTILLILRKI